MSSTPCSQPADCDFEEVDDKFELCSWANVNREIGAPALKQSSKAFNNQSIVSLKCKGNNKYWCAEIGGDSYIVADRGELNEWELFRMNFNDDNTVSIISLTNDKYVYITATGYMYSTLFFNCLSMINLNFNNLFIYKGILQIILITHPNLS